LMDGQLVTSQQVDLDVGTNRFVLPLDPLSPGHHLLRVQVEADDDTIAQNNSAGALIVVTGPPSVLIVEGSPGEGQYLSDALKSTGLNVDTGSPVAAPLDLTTLLNYASVVLVNV